MTATYFGGCIEVDLDVFRTDRKRPNDRDKKE